jgi:hypothetical protein
MGIDKDIRGVFWSSVPPDAPLRASMIRQLIDQTQGVGLVHRRTLRAWSWGSRPNQSPKVAPYGSPVNPATAFTFTGRFPWYLQKKSTRIFAVAVFATSLPWPLRFRLITENTVDAFVNTNGEWGESKKASTSALLHTNLNYNPEVMLIEYSMRLIPTALPATRRFALRIDGYVDGATLPPKGTGTYIELLSLMLRDA